MLEENVQTILGICILIATRPAYTNYVRNIFSGDEETSNRNGYICQRFPVLTLIIAFVKILKINKPKGY